MPSRRAVLLASAGGLAREECVVTPRHAVSEEEDGALCAACEPKQMEVYCTKLKTVQSCEQLFSRLWTQCQRCQGDLHKDVLCTSRDCPIFYKRKKVQKDLRDAKDVLRRFDADW